MRAVSSSPVGRVRAILFTALTVVLAGWLVLSAPAQVERFTAGMQIADGGPGIGPGGGGGG